MRNKSWLVIFISFVFSILLSQLVSAQYGFDFERSAGQIVEWIQEIFGPFLAALLGDYVTGEFLFAKVLFFILLLVVIRVVLDRTDLFGDNKVALNFVSIIIAVMAVRFLPEAGFIQGIMLPYSVLGVALLSIIPLLIYFFFVFNGIDNSIMRKIAWGLFAAIFIGLWWIRFEDLGYVAYIYLGAAILSCLFLIFENKIKSFMVYNNLTGDDIKKTQSIIELRNERDELTENLKDAQTRSERRRLKRAIRNKNKALKDLVSS